nr:hypothetical protein GCM10020063_098320 [Dactylosporangium thailandense]
MTEIRVDADLEHPPAVVWRAFTEAQLVTDWLPTTRFMVRDDGTFTFQAPDLAGLEDPIEGQIVKIEAPHRLVMRWEGSNLHTVVAVTLHEREDGTRLTMTQSGFLGPQGTMRRRVLLTTYSTLFNGPLIATLARLAAAPEPATPAPDPPTTPRRNDGGPFNRLPGQRNAPSRSAPGLSSRMRSTAGPRPTTSVPGFAAAVLTARATGIAQVTAATTAAAPTIADPAPTTFAGRIGPAVRAAWHRLAGARDWSADRRSQAVATSAAVLLLLALAAILIGKATALHPAGPPQTGGASEGPVQASMPAAVVPPDPHDLGPDRPGRLARPVPDPVAHPVGVGGSGPAHSGVQDREPDPDLVPGDGHHRQPLHDHGHRRRLGADHPAPAAGPEREQRLRRRDGPLPGPPLLHPGRRDPHTEARHHGHGPLRRQRPRRTQRALHLHDRPPGVLRHTGMKLWREGATLDPSRRWWRGSQHHPRGGDWFRLCL